MSEVRSASIWAASMYSPWEATLASIASTGLDGRNRGTRKADLSDQGVGDEPRQEKGQEAHRPWAVEAREAARLILLPRRSDRAGYRVLLVGPTLVR